MKNSPSPKPIRPPFLVQTGLFYIYKTLLEACLTFVKLSQTIFLKTFPKQENSCYEDWALFAKAAPKVRARQELMIVRRQSFCCSRSPSKGCAAPT